MRGGRDLFAVHLDAHRERHLMFGPMDFEQPVHLQIGRPVRPKLSIEVIESEDRGGIAATLEDVFVHAAIARRAAAVSAAYIDDHFAGCFAARGIETDGATLQFESAVNGVDHVGQSKTHFALRGIEIEHHLARNNAGHALQGGTGRKDQHKSGSQHGVFLRLDHIVMAVQA